jgi:hypothetical protein
MLWCHHVHVRACVRVCVCVCETERERERECCVSMTICLLYTNKRQIFLKVCINDMPQGVFPTDKL